MRTLLALTMMLAIGFGVSAAPPFPCDAVVVTQAEDVDEARVMAAVTKLEDAGADVRVYVLRTVTPYGSLDLLKEAMLDSCGSWQARNPDGTVGMKNNLVVFMVAMDDRKVGLFFGDQWGAALRDRWPTILSRDVAPRFRDGDLTGGIAAGLESVAGFIEPPTALQPLAPAPPVIVTNPPADLSFMTWLVVLAALLIAGYVAVRVVASNRRESGKRRAAQQAAASAKARSSAMALDLGEPLEVAKAQIGGLDRMGVPESVSEDLERKRGEAARAFAGAVATHQRVAETLDASRPGLSEDEYSHMAQVYLDSIAAFENVQKAVSALTGEIDSIRLRVGNVAKDADRLGERLKAVRTRIEEGRILFAELSAHPEAVWEPVRGNGTEAEKRLESATEIYSGLSLQPDSAWEDAESIREAGRLLDEAENLMRSVAARHKALNEAREAAAEELAAARTDLDRASAFLQQFDEDTRDSLKGDIEKAWGIYALAEGESKKDKPDYLRIVETALKANREADRIYDEARTEREAVVRLRRLAVSSVQGAERAFSAAREYEEDHRPDVGHDARELLKKAQDALARAQAETSDLARSVKIAAEAKELADGALHAAQEDFRAAEYRREQRRRTTVVLVPAPPRRRSNDNRPSFPWGSRGFGGSIGLGRSSRGGGGSRGW
jgi:uncharacterized membrane protein YgcG